MNHFPVFININKHPILVIGGGNIALRKAKSINAAGAVITLIADSILPEIANLNNISIIQRKATYDDISPKYKFIVIATNDGIVNERFANHCHSHNIMFNRVDEHDSNSFVIGSVVDSSPVLVAISTGVPEMSKLVKKQINKIISPELLTLADLMIKKRPELKKTSKGRLLMKKLATVETLQNIKQNGIEKITKEVNLCLSC